MFEPIQIRYSRRKAWWGVLFGVLLTLPAFTNAGRARWYWAVYLGLMLFNSLYIFRALFNRDVVLIIDDDGILDRRLGNLRIPWDRIDSVSLHHGERIFLNMTDTSHLGWEEGRFSIFHRPITRITRAGVLIDARGLKYDFDHIAEIVTGRMEYHRKKRERLTWPGESNHGRDTTLPVD